MKRNVRRRDKNIYDPNLKKIPGPVKDSFNGLQLKVDEDGYFYPVDDSEKSEEVAPNLLGFGSEIWTQAYQIQPEKAG